MSAFAFGTFFCRATRNRFVCLRCLWPVAPTGGERAVDVFYVRETDGGKVEDAARQQAIREKLLAVLNP